METGRISCRKGVVEGRLSYKRSITRYTLDAQNDAYLTSGTPDVLTGGMGQTSPDTSCVGALVGDTDGWNDGAVVGRCDGPWDGETVGCKVEPQDIMHSTLCSVPSPSDGS